MMMAELAMFSALAMGHRLSRMLSGQCSAAEYRRMVREKWQAAAESALALGHRTKRVDSAVLAPWHRRARANALRLGKKR